MNLKALPLLFAAISLSACAQSPVVVKPMPVPVAPKPASEGLTSQVLYQILLGEIASQRGELRLSAEAYADLASKTRDVRVAQRAVELARYAHQPALALRGAQLWRELEPGSVKAIQTLASMLLASGRVKEARPHLEAWLKLGPSAEVFTQFHALLARQKDKQAALDLVAELAVSYPALPEAHFAVAQVALQANHMRRALVALDEALRLRPQWETAVLLKAQVLSQQDGEGAAQAFLTTYLQANPGAREVRLAYAKSLARGGRFVESRVEFERLARDAPDDPEAHFTLGLVAMQTNDLASARGALLKSLELGHPDGDTVRYYLGQLEEADKQFETALTWYRQVGDSRHGFDAQLRVAAVLSRLGRLREAREWLAGLKTEDDAQRIQVAQSEAVMLRAAKNYPAVFEVLSRALEKMPDSQELLYDRAMAAEKIDRLDLLEQDLRRLIKLKPDHAHAYNALGYTLADRTNRLPEAVELLSQALKLAPEDPFILDSMGWALFKLKRLPEAVDHLRRAYKGKTDPEIAAHLGEALWAKNGKGDRDEARRVWQSSLKLHPDNENLREVVSRLKP
ncbi:MAG: tetratricopeptide repeat protein [Pseudomonadota bacterium]|nr:tetratricopeptide repeat protein [Pseudomonadota bacterium]MDP1572648.1 tetratricopeptide repeat protein [Pseudomonadota bacterium]MDP1906521.1 tetratricopeptide repeat protein [Pseudomonadota bacterium]